MPNSKATTLKMSVSAVPVCHATACCACLSRPVHAGKVRRELLAALLRQCELASMRCLLVTWRLSVVLLDRIHQ